MKGFLIVAVATAAAFTYAVIPEAAPVSTQPTILEQEWNQQDVINTVGYVALQHDSIKKNADSIRLETCRGGTLNPSGTCSGRKLSPRTTYLYRWQMRIQHHAYRADSSLNQLMIRITPPVPTPNIGFAIQPYYNSDSAYLSRPGVDTVTVCAVITDANGIKKLGWPAVRLTQGRADSTGWSRRGGNPLEVMCRSAIERAGVTGVVDSASATPIEWRGQWTAIYNRQLFRPFAFLP
jgi:hypothetical protein